MHLKNNAVISQHGFPKVKSCLTDWISYDKVTCLVGEGKAVDGVFPGF